MNKFFTDDSKFSFFLENRRYITVFGVTKTLNKELELKLQPTSFATALMDWSSNGQMLSVCDKNRFLQTYAYDRTFIWAAYQTRIAYLVSPSELIISDISLRNEQKHTLVDKRPDCVGVGPSNFALGFGRIVWVYSNKVDRDEKKQLMVDHDAKVNIIE